MKILQIGADRSKRVILFPGSPAFKGQEACAKQFGHLDIIGFSLKGEARPVDAASLRIYPTGSPAKWRFGFDALRIARGLERPDVVSVQDPFETGLVGWLIARRFKVPLHVQIHTDFLSPAYAQLSLMNRARVLLAGFVLRRAAGIRVVSVRIKGSIEAHGVACRVAVLPIFIDIDRVRGAADATVTSRFGSFGIRALVVSRLEPEKNVALALRAFASSASSDSCLIVVGTGTEKVSLQHFAKRLNVAERVFFEGEHDAAPYYAFSDIVLVPSKYEGYGLVAVEALAAGKPVLSTDVGVAREAGAIVTTGEKFADALAEWFKSGPRTGELKNYPYKNFDEYVQAYCDDIESCIKAQKGHTTAI